MNEEDKKAFLEDFKNADISKKLDMWFYALEQEGIWEEIISEIIKRQQELYNQEELIKKEESGEEVHMTPEELDSFMNEGLDDGDLLFIDSPAELEKKLIWESEETQKLNSLLVKPLSEKDSDSIFTGESASDVKSVPKRKKSRVTLE